MEFLARRFAPFRLPGRLMAGCLGSLLAVILVFGVVAPAALAADETDTVIALRLADMLRSARSVISQYQKVINDPEKGDKGLTGERVLAETIAVYQKQTGEDPLATDPNSKEGRLLRVQMDAIKQVVDENQHTINAPGVGFKGFIPAVFARLVNEKFAASVGQEALVKVTAPEDLIRNRKARPDAWETSVITDKFSKPDWQKGTPFSETTTVDNRPAFRLIVPEYYAKSCLACHGEPKGETDITGYPKEGGKEGDLGAAISITLFQ
jgi:archaellum component FlaG (FlaF/FlaG flagellin family)